MGKFDFDRVIQRRQTASVKWDLPDFQGVLPMWVADMDFACPEVILEAIKQRVNHGIFGYSLPPESLVEATVARIQTNYGYSISPDWLVWLPGLETALTLASMSVGLEQSSCLCFNPIYPPFYTGPRKAGRTMVRLPFIRHEKTWEVDWEVLEQHFAQGQVKLFLLCNPHNPVGKVFERWELERLALMCLRHHITICSDEVHCDLILGSKSHHCLATLSPEICQQTITLMAPSKTFNIAGLGCGFAIISNEKIRQSFRISIRSITPGVNPLAFAACEAAYLHGEPWRLELLDVLRLNAQKLQHFIQTEMSGIKMLAPEATYLGWLECEALKLKDPSAHFKAYGLGFSGGGQFGDDNSMRINFACPSSTLQTAFERMRLALNAIT